MSRSAAVLQEPTTTTSSIPWVLPFAVFIGMLAVAPWLHFLGAWEYPFRVGLLAAVLYAFSRQVLDFRISRPALTTLTGILVFALWIAPDLLIPGYRDHWLFQNAVTGRLTSSLLPEHRGDAMVLAFRFVRAAILVPIIEELFWRGWLLRWLQSKDFHTVPLGRWTWSAMVISVVLFASEHGPYWEVGLMAGIAYNWLMVRTKSLGDCILAHGITNGLLSAYVIWTGRWEFWM